MIRKTTWRLATLAGAVCLPGVAVAADDDRMLAPVLVQAQRGSALPVADMPAYSRTALPASVSAEQTFTREDIQALRPRDVYDLMETSLGMSISRQGSRVNNFSSNRGGEVSFLLDGVYLTSTEAQRVVGDIPVAMIDSIRFVRDASVLSITPVMGFGGRVSAPAQGVVVINTLKSGQTPDGVELKGSLASYGTAKGSVVFNRSLADGRLTLGGGVQHAQSDGKPDWNNGYQNDTYMLNGGWKDQNFLAAASLYVNRSDRKIQRYIGVMGGASVRVGELGPEIWKYDPRDTQLFSLNLARHWNERHTTALTYGRSKVDGYGYFATVSNRNPPAQYFRDESSDLNLSHTIRDPDNLFKIGAQRISWYQQTESTGAGAPRKEAIYGLYLSDEYRLSPSWALDGSVRVDRKRIIKGGDKYGNKGEVVKLSEGVWTDKAYLLSLGSAWQINPTYRLTGRYAYSVTPTPDTLTTTRDLPAEKLNRWELGVQAYFHPALQAALTPFYYTAKNAKVVDASAPKVSVINAITGATEFLDVYTSANRITRKGLELSLKGRLAEGGYGALGYELGWSHFKDGSINSSSGGVQVPKDRYSARLDWRYGRWNSTLGVLRVDEYCHYFQRACLPSGDFTTVNLNISRTFDHGVTVSLFGQNITNQRYYTRHKTGNGQTQFEKSYGALADVGATWGVEVEVKF